MKYGDKAVIDYADVSNWEIWDAPKDEEVVYHAFPEFTCKCPRSGYPDFAKVHIVEVPDKKVVELKVLKLWLNGFRDVNISHENACQQIFDTLWETLKPKALFIAMEYTPRGNLDTFPTKFKVKKITDEARFTLESMVQDITGAMICK